MNHEISDILINFCSANFLKCSEVQEFDTLDHIRTVKESVSLCVYNK